MFTVNIFCKTFLGQNLIYQQSLKMHLFSSLKPNKHTVELTEIRNNAYQYNSLWQASARRGRVVRKGFSVEFWKKANMMQLQAIKGNIHIIEYYIINMGKMGTYERFAGSYCKYKTPSQSMLQSLVQFPYNVRVNVLRSLLYHNSYTVSEVLGIKE